MTTQTVHCTSCGRENDSAANYCEGCGAWLGLRCVACQAHLSPIASFCAECGRRVAGSDSETTVASVRVDHETGERRQLTVLFCDLVGSTELAVRLDPEAWYEVASQYQRKITETVARFDGNVAKYLGDGLMVCFGWPRAHEDDAERGVRAGLAILGTVRQLASAVGLPLEVRVAVHTGAVVVAEGGGGVPEIFGEVPNVAARLQAIAEAGTVIISATTQRLVAGLFVLQDRGPVTLRGVPEAVTSYRVRGPSGIRGRLLAVAGARGLTPFVAREAERLVLRRRWERACDGQGQMVLIAGEPGIGKSRLVCQFRAELRTIAYTWAYCACSPLLQDTPLHPAVGMLQDALAWGRNEDPTVQLAGLEAALRWAGVDPEEAVPLLAPLIELPLPAAKYPPPLCGPEQQRKKLLAMLVTWVLGATRTQPLVIVVEDLQWADPSTLELHQLLVDQAAAARLLLVYTARPEFKVPWPLRSHHTHVTLNRLSRAEARAMIHRIVPATHLAEPAVEAIVARSDGVPLFVEELARTLTQNPAAAPDIPATLRDSLMARLDRLGEAKEIAQVGAVLGREFSYELLRHVMGLPDEKLEAALDRLAGAAILCPYGFPPRATYTFEHALLHDAAYSSVLKARRRELHRAAAVALRDRFGRLAEMQPELLARHWTESGDVEPAAAAWRAAGERARARGAHAEAAQHFTREIALLAELPKSPARDQQELMAQLRLGQSGIVTKGYGAPEPTRAFARAQQLSEKIGATQQNALFLLGRSASALGRGELQIAGTLAEQLARIGERQHVREMITWAYAQLATVRLFVGDPAGARMHAARAVACYDADDHRDSPQDPAVVARSSASLAAAALGLVTEARALSAASLDLADRLGRPADRAFAGTFASALHVLLGEPEPAARLATQTIALSAQEHLEVFHAVATICRAGAYAGRRPADEAVDAIRTSLRTLSAIRFRNGATQYFAWLVVALRSGGQLVEALAAVEDGLTAAPEEGFYRPELLRLRAGLLAETDADVPIVDAAYRDAITLADTQAHRVFGLRAALSFARWLDQTDRAPAASALLNWRRAMIAEVSNVQEAQPALGVAEGVSADHAA